VVKNRADNLTDHSSGYGAGVYVANAAAVWIRSCEISDNYMYAATWHNRALGGGIAGGNATVLLEDCVVRNNQAYAGGGNYDYAWSRGGGIYHEGTGNWTLRRCVVSGNQVSGSGSIYHNGGGIYLAAGNHLVENTLVANNQAQTLADGVYALNGNSRFFQTTVASNGGEGLRMSAGFAFITNSILWGNGDDVVGVASNYLHYTCVQDGDAAGYQGCISNTPGFVDGVFFHVRSRAGHYTNGYFSGGGWAYDTNTISPAIDAGDPSRPYAGELQPHGYRANIGCYGNTETASRTFVEEPGRFTNLTVHSYPATNVGTTSAWLNGQVLETGPGPNPRVYFCWDSSDKGTNAFLNWTHSVYLGTNWGDWACFSTNVTGLSGWVYYRCYVTNATGQDWSHPVESLECARLAAVTNLGAFGMQRRTAWLRGEITDIGGQAPMARFHYWTQGGGSTSVVSAGIQSGAFTNRIGGFLPGSNYAYRLSVSNSAGIAWSGEKAFNMITQTPRDWFVNPAGDNTAGTNWSTGMRDLRAALQVMETNDALRLARGTHVVTGQVSLTVNGGTLAGGYAATNAAGPGAQDPAAWPTVIQRDALQVRLLSISGVKTARIERIRFRNGYVNGDNYGGAVSVVNARAVRFEECVFTNNTAYSTIDHGIGRGGALYAVNATGLVVNGCEVWNNRAYGIGWHVGSFGGGLYLVNSLAVVSNSWFRANRAIVDVGNPGYSYAHGGGIYIQGGACTVSHSIFEENRCEGSTMPHVGAGIYVNGGSHRVRNCMIIRNDSTDAAGIADGVHLAAGTLGLMHVTVATNWGEGVRYAGGTLWITNAILWANGDDLVSVSNDVGYTCIEDGDFNGTNGCVMTDPLFYDTTWFHLNSKEGTYSGGFFSGGTWRAGTRYSPLMDRAAPGSPWAAEPVPNRWRANLGAYGNTAVASCSYMPGNVVVIR